MLKSRFDQRVDRLEELMEDRIQLYEIILQPPGTQPMLTNQLTSEKSLAFWRKHRFDAIGRTVLSAYSPMQVAELDAWLSEQVPNQALA